jgi:hypothetical protein
VEFKTLNIQRFGSGANADMGDNMFSIMTEGIDEEGIATIYNTIHSYLTNQAKEALENYNEFFTALDEGWIGNDREVFKANLKMAVTKVEKLWEEYDAMIKGEFDSIIASWREHERTNVVAKN